MRKQRKLTEEHKEKIRNSLTGKKRAEETKRKISDSMKRYWDSIPYEINKEDINGLNGERE